MMIDLKVERKYHILMSYKKDLEILEFLRDFFIKKSKIFI